MKYPPSSDTFPKFEIYCSGFWVRNIGFKGISFNRGVSEGQAKFMTLDSRPKFRTRRMGPECQMGSANITQVEFQVIQIEIKNG